MTKKKLSALKDNLVLIRLTLLSFDRTLLRMEQLLGMKRWGKRFDSKRPPKT